MPDIAPMDDDVTITIGDATVAVDSISFTHEREHAHRPLPTGTVLTGEFVIHNPNDPVLRAIRNASGPAQIPTGTEEYTEEGEDEGEDEDGRVHCPYCETDDVRPLATRDGADEYVCQKQDHDECDGYFVVPAE